MKVRESILLDFCTFVSIMDIPISNHKTRDRSGNNNGGNRITLSKGCADFYAAKMSYNIFGVRITDEDQIFK